MEIKKIIHASEVDFELKASLFALSNIVQNGLTEALGEIHFDNVVLREKYHAMWVFTKNKMKCMRRPEWNEHLTIRIAIKKTTKILIYMSVDMIDEAGITIVTSLTELCVLDLDRFRFVRLSAIDFPVFDEEVDTSYMMEDCAFKQQIPVQIKASMIDYSIHLNNAQSSLIYLDSLSLEETHTIFESPFTFVIKYISQAHFNDSIFLKKGNRDGLYQYALVRDDGEEVVLAQIKKITN